MNLIRIAYKTFSADFLGIFSPSAKKAGLRKILTVKTFIKARKVKRLIR